MLCHQLILIFFLETVCQCFYQVNTYNSIEREHKIKFFYHPNIYDILFLNHNCINCIKNLYIFNNNNKCLFFNIPYIMYIGFHNICIFKMKNMCNFLYLLFIELCIFRQNIISAYCEQIFYRCTIVCPHLSILLKNTLEDK